MKRILFVLFLMVLFIPFASAGTIEQAGFSVSPQTKTDSAHGGTETDTIVWSPADGKKIVLMGVAFSSDAANNFFVFNVGIRRIIRR